MESTLSVAVIKITPQQRRELEEIVGRRSRHGVVDLSAALEIATGKVTHRVTDAHTAIDFLAFVNKVDRAYPAQDRENAELLAPHMISAAGA